MAKPTEAWDSYKYKTEEELDREVESALKADKTRRTILITIIVTAILFTFPDAFLYWFRFATPHSPKQEINEVIDVSQNPTQINIQSDKEQYIKYNTLENRGSYKLKKLAEYSISGKVVAKNYFFWGNYIPKGDRPFQSVALMDIGLVWGTMADKEVLRNYQFVSSKSAVARTLYPRLKHGVTQAPLTWNYAQSLFSHTHVIPATPSVMHALLFSGKNQPIKMDGYLVDVYDNGKIIAQTSLSRIDTNKSSRSGGACEVMYVERVQIKNKVYE